MKNRNTGPRKVFLGGIPLGAFIHLRPGSESWEANRIFVLKGGPGMGKSTFMRKIGEAMSAQGYHIEYCCCSSDNDSRTASTYLKSG